MQVNSAFGRAFSVSPHIGNYSYISALKGSQQIYLYMSIVSNDNFFIKIVSKNEVKDCKNQTILLTMVEFTRSLKQIPFTPLVDFLEDKKNYYLVFPSPNPTTSISFEELISRLRNAKNNQDASFHFNYDYVVFQIIEALEFLGHYDQDLLFTPTSIYINPTTFEFTHIYLNQLDSHFSFDDFQMITNFTPPEFLSGNPTSKSQKSINSWLLGIFLYYLHSYGKKPFDGETIDDVWGNLLSIHPEYAFIQMNPPNLKLQCEIQNDKATQELLEKLLMKNPAARMDFDKAKEKIIGQMATKPSVSFPTLNEIQSTDLEPLPSKVKSSVSLNSMEIAHSFSTAQDSSSNAENTQSESSTSNTGASVAKKKKKAKNYKDNVRDFHVRLTPRKSIPSSMGMKKHSS